MKFLYEYRTRDNVHHDGEINAASRDAAFAALRSQGIKPGRLVEAPGFFNKLFGKGKRWIAIGALAALSVGLGALVVVKSKRQVSTTIFETSTRHQVIGDTAIIEKGLTTGWADVFPDEGDRYLASFAVPGVPAAKRTAPEKAILAAVARKVLIEPGDSIEVRQIKVMLEGVKDELREFLAAGGSVRRFVYHLQKRQEEEITYFSRAKAEVDAAVRAGASRDSVIAVWEKCNSRLRHMGIRLVALPEAR